MENGIDAVGLQTAQHIPAVHDVAVEEAEVGKSQQLARVVERTAVVEFVEADNVVRVRVFGYEVSDEPRGDEAFSSGDEDVAYVREGLEGGVAGQEGSVFPAAVVEEEAGWEAAWLGRSVGQSVILPFVAFQR